MKALRAAGFERNPVPSGRTDAGVHARMQVLSMRVVGDVGEAEVAARINTHLPESVGIALVRPASARFNAAWLSVGKRYRYSISTDDDRWAWRTRVDGDRLAPVLEHFRGSRDFGAFHDRSSPRKLRTIEALTVTRSDDAIQLHVTGEGFARYMVRLIVGAAVAVARDEMSEATLLEALRNPDAQDFQRFRAPARGLMLDEVFYPPEVDPFSAGDRSAAPGLPQRPPFV